MTAALTPVPKIQFFADDGTPLVGGKLYSYAAGTTTPLATYTTYAGTVANTNPVILDSRGEANVWLGASFYKLALYDADDALIWTVDNITPEGDAALVSYLPAGTGAVVTTVQAKLRESVSVADFGAVGDGVTDDTAAIQAALNTGAQVTFEKLTYLISSSLSVPSGGGLIGKGTAQYPLAAYNSDTTVFNGSTRILASAAFPASRAMVEVNTSAGANYAKQGVYVGNLVLDCNSVAQKGLELSTVKQSTFENLFIRLATSIGLNVTCNSVANATVKGNNATQFNNFNNITSYVAYNGNVTSAVGIYLTGNINNNVNQNTWTNIYVVHGNGNGIEIHNADTDLWARVNTLSWGTGYGCVLYGDDTGTTQFARNITMVGVQFSGAFGTGGLLAKSGAGFSSNWNMVFGYSQGNGSPAPIVENGARFSWYTESGPVISDPNFPIEAFNRTNSYGAGNTISDRIHQGKITAGGVVTFAEERIYSRGGAGAEYGEWVLNAYDAGTSYEMLKVSHLNGISFGGGTGIKKILSAGVALDFPSIAAQSSQVLTVTVTGANVNDPVAVGLPSNGINAALVTNAYVSAADTVSVRVLNVSAAAVDPGSLFFRVTVFVY